MRAHSLLVLVIGIVVALGASTSHAGAVVGGHRAQASAWPGLVALLDTSADDPLEAQFCAGVTLDRHHVLTAAHCVERGRRARPARTLDVAPARAMLEQIRREDRVRVQRVIHYPGRRHDGDVDQGDDIAILRLRRAIDARPVPLPAAPVERSARERARIAGWGATDPDGDMLSEHLRAGSVRVVKDSACAKFIVPERTLCATTPDSREPSACSGDSGGPLVGAGGARRDELLGITSIGPDYCGRGVMTVYTDVWAYREWISQVLRAGAETMPLRRHRAPGPRRPLG